MYKALRHLGFTEDDFILVDEGKGPFIAKWMSAIRQPDAATIAQAQIEAESQEQAEAAERKAADDQQAAGIVEAKRAYARMQQIIDGADTATTVQLRAAIKEMARDIQHLIRAAVR